MSRGPNLPMLAKRRTVATARRRAKALEDLRRMGIAPITEDRQPATGTRAGGTHGSLVYRPGAIAFSLLGGGVFIPGA